MKKLVCFGLVLLCAGFTLFVGCASQAPDYYDRDIAKYTAALERNPKKWETWHSRAYTYYNKGDFYHNVKK